MEILNASRQGWSGGIKGNYGTNYSITLKLSPKKCKLDSIYIYNKDYRLDSNPGGNVLHDTTNDALIISITDGHYRNDNEIPTSVLPIRHFDGVALIVYTYKRKQFTFIVKKIEELLPLSYP